MAGFDNDVMWADNVRFDGGSYPGAVTTDGQLLVGSTAAPNIRVGTLTSPSGTITIGYASPNITIDLAGGSVGIDSIAVQAVTAPGVSPVLPTGAGLVTFNGATVAPQLIPVQSRSIALNSYQLEVQRASSSVGTNATQQGLASFNSAHFVVDGNGWVSAIAAPFTWQDFAGGAMSSSNGYFATAAAAYTLPLGVTDGEIVEIIDNIGGGVVVTAAGAQTIRVQNTISSAGGTATSTQFGDALRLIFRASIGEWQTCAGAGGNWILA